MALPPTTEINETFLREVDENLRRDRVHDFFRDNRGLLIAALILFLATAGGIIWWQQHQIDKSGEEVEQLAKVYRDIGDSKLDKVPAEIGPLASSSSKSVRASALFTRAALALEQNDSALASTTYGAIANDSSMPQPYRDAALLRQTTLDFDKLKPEEVISRLAPLAKPDSAWFGSAGEMTAMALIKQGKTLEAGKSFAAIAANKDVPVSMRARAVQVAGTLGVDASAALPPSAQ
ncbi:MAG: tetratricopeptide repeat protein [Pseudomonadota bacterium]|nr:tetratricopeptide repeat protein [Pseudomonadota bacterium]